MSKWEDLKNEWDKEDIKTHCLPRCPRCQGAPL